MRSFYRNLYTFYQRSLAAPHAAGCLFGYYATVSNRVPGAPDSGAMRSRPGSQRSQTALTTHRDDCAVPGTPAFITHP